MDSLETAVGFYDVGRFGDALRALERGSVNQAARIASQVLKAELQQAVGRLQDAQTLARSLLKSDRLSVAEKSSCEYVLGKIAREDAEYDLAIQHFQRSVSLALQAKYSRRLCLAQIQLMLTVADRSGPNASSALVAEVKKNAMKLGDPGTTANLHIYVGEMEAKRGLLGSAQRHAQAAIGLLQSAPNCWLEAAAENVLFAIALIRSEFATALPHGMRALELSEQSENAAVFRASIANLGTAFYSLGDFDRAIEYFDRAVRTLPSTCTKHWWIDNVAQVKLTQGLLDECESILGDIDSSVVDARDRSIYAYRCAAFTKAVLLARQGRIEEAIAQADRVRDLADSVGDQFLLTKVSILKLEYLQRAYRTEEFRAALDSIALDFETPEMYAQYERILAAASAASGRKRAAVRHYERAERVCKAIEHVPAQLELARCRDVIADPQVTDSSSTDSRSVESSDFQSIALPVLHSIAAVFANVSRPEIIGRELLAILRGTDIRAASFVSSNDKGTYEVIESIDLGQAGVFSGGPRELKVGSSRGREFRLIVEPAESAESAATVNAVAILIDAVQGLLRARTEHEQRATFWPVEELPSVGGQAVITGHMRELMTLVERVASVNISVLIFGESGTGKEIIAHAIHDCSDRAKNAFVPLNCAAVPRELMESQLFGHRRGAFTGADRDFAGFIRAADNGTLFLDEIAELSLDLQPKLLRFLESGEIAPIGEPAPLHVNVRVLAATNKNLEELVREGKFREDLFYRLNVVPLTIRPLRERRDEIPALVQHLVDRAAVQFKKGHLTVAEETMERLLLYRWPGNVRQLQHELQRIVALAEPNSTILPEAISAEILGALPLLRPTAPPVRELAVSLNEKLPSTIARIECEMIKIALRDSHGKVDAAAKALGISRKGLYLKRQRLGL